ncbi:PQQ-binding-like beta-propeller repeat protein [Candidatus Mesenet endosymbiont of Agriotes lineatus]|uniref:PQQ-binding-like beta-propeller repeat protein n=1 Tax=Candidatus Mesenet endosymbiont of Agriotes lineatus TaxID=3077948 RepID=UPI0030CDD691
MKTLGLTLFLLLLTLATTNSEAKNTKSDISAEQIKNQSFQLKRSPVITKSSQGTVAPVVLKDDLAVLDAQGSLYLLNNKNLSDLKWQLNLSTKKYIRASLLYQNNYIFCTIENVVYKIEPKKGKIIWQKELKAPIKGKVAILNDVLVALTVDNYLYAISVKDSNLIWSYQGNQVEFVKLNSASPIVQDNIIIVPFSSGDLVAFNEYGAKLWDYKLPTSGFLDHPFTTIISTPRIQGGKVIVTNGSGIFALNLNSGNEIWSQTLSVKAVSEITKNSVFIITNDNKVVVLDLLNGQPIWTLELAKMDNSTYFNEPVFAQNKLFITTNQGMLMEIDPSAGTIEKVVSIPKGIYHTLVSSDSSFYVTTNGGGLFKIMRDLYE